MESQPQNPEFRINPENFHQCSYILPVVSVFLHFFFTFLPNSSDG